MQGSRPVLALGSHVGAMLDEEPRQIYIPLEGCPIERSRPVLPLGSYIGAVFNEKPCQIQMTP